MDKSKNSNGASGSASDCIFCKIVDKKIPAEIIHEDNHSISFLDINPVNEGHLLIIPKDHFPQMTETPDELMEKLFLKAKNLMPVLKKVLEADFVTLTVVGTDVLHFHIHLIPRFSKDGLAGFWPSKKYESEERMAEISQKIKMGLEK